MQNLSSSACLPHKANKPQQQALHYHAKKIRAGQHPVYKHVKVNCDTITTIETMADIKTKIANAARVPMPSIAQSSQSAQTAAPKHEHIDEYDDDPLGWGFDLD